MIASRRLTQAELVAERKTERLIVVGRNSYIGGCFTQYAQARGASVMSLSSQDCNFLDRSEVERFFRSLDSQSSTIVFLATVNKNVTSTYQSFLDNAQMVKHLIDGQRHARINSILSFSAADVYGTTPPVPLTEDAPVSPESWYSLGKAAGDWMLQHAEELRCPVTILRIPGIFGQAPRDRSLIGCFISEARTAGRVTIHGTGTSLRDYVSLNDLCRVIEGLLPLRYHGVVNVATGRSVRIIDIVRLISEVLKLDYTTVFDEPDPKRTFDLVFDVGRLKSLLPDFQFSELTEGIRTYQWT
ncbi:MAG: NAD-dependent epimerase/dehydratase family protein [Candidatus Omnitrophota bacterium]|nr:NAD-dependent epimerase/dehydratase family protein [Candidatus Omnitrophota bacterium]